MGAKTTVDGATTLVRTLGEAERDLADLAPPEAGAFIQQRARAAAPFVTGALRASLTSEATAGVVQVGSDLPYAAVIHNGWAAHNIVANPYLIPVAEDTESIWGPLYEAAVARVIRADVKGA